MNFSFISLENNFANKVVWITGASSGIGEALVKQFSNVGALLVLSSRREETLVALAEDLQLSKEKYLILPIDLERNIEANNWLELIIKKFGRIDIVVNNGGISQRSLAQETPIEIDRKLFEVDYFSYVAITKAVLPYFIKQKSGQVIVISSIAGKFGFYYRSSYSAAKHALHGFFESLRLEIEQYNIKVIIVCPGKIKTNVSNNAILFDGNAHNIVDPSHLNAMSADECAAIVMKGIKQNKEEIFVGRKELLMVDIKRFLPKLFSIIVRKVKRD